MADDYNHKLALAIRDVLTILMAAATHFMFGRSRAGRNGLRRAARKLDTLRVQIDQQMGPLR